MLNHCHGDCDANGAGGKCRFHAERFPCADIMLPLTSYRWPSQEKRRMRTKENDLSNT